MEEQERRNRIEQRDKITERLGPVLLFIILVMGIVGLQVLYKLVQPVPFPSPLSTQLKPPSCRPQLRQTAYGTSNTITLSSAVQANNVLVVMYTTKGGYTSLSVNEFSNLDCY